MIIKESTNNICTAILSATEVTEVTFPNSYNYFFVRNDGTTTIFASVSDSMVTANGDGVISIPAGTMICTGHAFPCKKLYISAGTGSAFITAANSNTLPLGNSSSGGSGNWLPITGGTMEGTLVTYANTDYTTAQVRNATMSTAEPSGGSNGQVHYQYS